MMHNFVAKHKPEWEELETLVRKAQRAPRRLRPQELQRLDRLYRRTTTHLAQVATRTRDAGLIQYLNRLTAAAHSAIYLPPRKAVFRNAGVFLRDDFARLVCRLWRYHLLSAGLLVFGFIIAFYAVAREPLAAYALLPPGEMRMPGAAPEQLLETLRHGRDQGGGEKFAFASMLLGHNLRVAVLALAAGVLAMAPTTLLMTYNGMILGALAAVFHGSGIRAEFWGWVLPHGITELLAIVLCGGVGLRLGMGVLRPGLHTRAESLRIAGGEAARTVVGVALMLAFAAAVESYLRQSNLSLAGRLGFAALTLCFWVLYLGRGALLERRAARLDENQLG